MEIDMVHKDEIYCFICGKFKVYELYQWAKENVELISVSLDNLSKIYGFIKNKDSNTESLFRLDKEYAKKLSKEDVEQPLLFVDLGEGGYLLIDGTHRAYHMWHNGKVEANAYVISNDDIILEHSSVPKKMLEHLRA
jgi:hypothetical protein